MHFFCKKSREVGGSRNPPTKLLKAGNYAVLKGTGIQVRLMPAAMMFTYYLENKKIDIREVCLFSERTPYEELIAERFY